MCALHRRPAAGRTAPGAMAIPPSQQPAPAPDQARSGASAASAGSWAGRRGRARRPSAAVGGTAAAAGPAGRGGGRRASRSVRSWRRARRGAGRRPSAAARRAGSATGGVRGLQRSGAGRWPRPSAAAPLPRGGGGGAPIVAGDCRRAGAIAASGIGATRERGGSATPGARRVGRGALRPGRARLPGGPFRRPGAALGQRDGRARPRRGGSSWPFSPRAESAMRRASGAGAAARVVVRGVGGGPSRGAASGSAWSSLRSVVAIKTPL